ncbi:MAG: glycosyltransferase [Phycisphaeraceae bacterium]|nr:glycosyltransferase [Phycisphaeraceae bacterium]
MKPSIGGGFTFVEEVARAIDEGVAPAGVEVIIVSQASEGAAANGAAPRPGTPRRVTYRPEGTVDRLRLRLARSSQRLWKRLGGASAVERAARSAGASIVWFPTGGSEAIDLPFVATVWDIQHRTHPWFPEVSASGLWRARDDSSRELLARAALVVCGTEAGAGELERYYQVPRERIVIAPHPTPGWALRDGAGDLSAVPDGPFFLYPAQFWPHKNHAMLLRALARRRQSGSRASLVLVGGDQGIRARLSALAEQLGIADAVHFPGFISREALRGLYRRATGLVYAAFSGPENLPPLEAFALGCPVTNADFPGAREQLGDGAIYFDPMLDASIAAAMESLESDGALRARLVAAGAERARSRRGDDFVRTVLHAIAARAPMIDPLT